MKKKFILRSSADVDHTVTRLLELEPKIQQGTEAKREWDVLADALLRYDRRKVRRRQGPFNCSISTGA